MQPTVYRKSRTSTAWLKQATKIPPDLFDSIATELGFPSDKPHYSDLEAHFLITTIRAWYLYRFSSLLSNYPL